MSKSDTPSCGCIVFFITGLIILMAISFISAAINEAINKVKRTVNEFKNALDDGIGGIIDFFGENLWFLLFAFLVLYVISKLFSSRN